MSSNSFLNREGKQEEDFEICVIGNGGKYLCPTLGLFSVLNSNKLRKIDIFIATGSSSIIALLLSLSIPIESIKEILMTTTILDKIYNHVPVKVKTTGLMSIFSSHDNKNIILLDELKLWFEKILKNLGYSPYLTFSHLTKTCILTVENIHECKVYTLSKNTTPDMLLSDAVRLSLLQHTFNYEEEISIYLPLNIANFSFEYSPLNALAGFNPCHSQRGEDDDNDSNHNDSNHNDSGNNDSNNNNNNNSPTPPSTLPYSLMRSSDHIQLKSNFKLQREKKTVKINAASLLCHYPIELADIYPKNKILGVQTIIELPLYSIDEIFHTKNCQMLRKDTHNVKENFLDYQSKRNLSQRYNSSISIDITDFISDGTTSYQTHILMFKRGIETFINRMVAMPRNREEEL